MLNTIKEVLTCYNQSYNLTLECIDIMQSGSNLKIKEKITDHSDGDKEYIFDCVVPLPELALDNKTYINVALDNRRVKVVAGGNTIIIGSKARNEYSLEIMVDSHSFNVYKKSTDELLYPRKILKGRKMVPAYDPFMIFSTYPGLKSEYFRDLYPVIPPEYRIDVNNIIGECVFDKELIDSMSIFTKRKLTTNTLSAEFLQAILVMIDNKDTLNEVPLPSDFKVGTTGNIIESYIRAARYKIQNRIMKTFYKVKVGTANTISMSELRSALFKITRDNPEEGDGINPYQQDTNTNALSLVSQSSKTYFKSYNRETQKYVSKTLDPKYFVGIIDPAFTADSNLVNIKNQLARSAVIEDDGFKVKLMTKDFKPVIVDSVTYLMSATLSSDNVDYINKKLIPNQYGEYSVYQFGEYKYVTSLDEVDYIRYQDSIISESTALLPFVNKTVPMRVMLATHMIADQAVPVVGAKPSIIYTDVNKEIYDESKQVVRSESSGKVKGIGTKFININDKPVEVPITEASTNHTTITYNKKLRVGQNLKPGDVIVESNSFIDKEFAVGVPLFTAYTGWYGWEHEDAMVLSESAAKKMGHLDTTTIRIPIKYSKINFPEIHDINLDNHNLIKSGAKVKGGDTLFAYNQVVSNLGIDVNKLIVVKVPSHIQGTVRDVRFKLYESQKTHGVDSHKYLRPEYDGLPDLLKHFNNRLNLDLAQEAKATGLDQIDIAKAFQFYIEEPSIADSIFAEIIITIDYINPAKTADKMVNKFGGKGTISKIVPDDMFLRTEDGKVVDIIISPLAILSRTNISQLYESLLSLICVEFYKILDGYFKGDSVIRSKYSEELLQSVADDLYWYNKSNDLRKIYEESKKYGYCRVQVSSFDKHFTEELLKSMRDRLGIKDEVRLFDPISNKFIRTPIRVGYQDFYRLHFFPENKMTTRGGNKGLNLKDRTPAIGGYGRIKSEGQKIGEMEMWALQSHGLNKLSQSYINKAGKQDKIMSDMLSLELALEENE